MATAASAARTPLACDLGALTHQQRERHERLWAKVASRAPEPTATAHGVAFPLPNEPGLADELVELAALEQRCCPFLRITVALEPEGESLTLELGGDERVRTFLADNGFPAR